MIVYCLDQCLPLYYSHIVFKTGVRIFALIVNIVTTSFRGCPKLLQPSGDLFCHFVYSPINRKNCKHFVEKDSRQWEV